MVNLIEYQTQVMKWAKDGAQIIEAMTPTRMHGFHMAAALVGEAVEFSVAVQENDVENQIEELGDIIFFFVGLMYVYDYAACLHAYEGGAGVSEKELKDVNKNLNILKNATTIEQEVLICCEQIFDCIKKVVAHNGELKEYTYGVFASKLYSEVLPVAAAQHGMTIKEVFNKNYEKLSARFGLEYSDSAAQLRADKG